MEPQSVAFQTFIFGSETRSKKRDDVISHCWSASHGSRHPIWLNALVSGERCHYLCLCWVFRNFFSTYYSLALEHCHIGNCILSDRCLNPFLHEYFIKMPGYKIWEKIFNIVISDFVPWQTFKPNYKNWNC